MLHRTRALLIRHHAMLANAFRAHLAEFGIVVPQGIRHVRALVEKVFGEDAIDLPVLARTARYRSSMQAARRCAMPRRFSISRSASSPPSEHRCPVSNRLAADR
jgi:transposase